jgi:hypothetical protein
MMDYFKAALEQLAPGKHWVNRVDMIEWVDAEWTDIEVKPTWDQINTVINQLRADEPMRLLREERDRRLMACDYVVVKAIEHGTEVSQAWKDYRQALRDLPSTSSPQCWPTDILIMESIGWPTPPQE